MTVTNRVKESVVHLRQQTFGPEVSHKLLESLCDSTKDDDSEELGLIWQSYALQAGGQTLFITPLTEQQRDSVHKKVL